jgi:hypothetical protein
MKAVLLVLAIVSGLSALTTPIVIWFKPTLMIDSELELALMMYGGGFIAFLSTLVLTLKNQHS